jgi:hypothetical protein
MTFEEVSLPYVRIFGKPDQSHEFKLENEIYVQWYYYREDVVVEFVCPQNEKIKGWELSFAFSLDPLKLLKDNK